VNEPTDITKAVRQVHPLLESLLGASDRMQSYSAVSEIAIYLEPGTEDRILAFCVESWQVGRAVFNAALTSGIADVSEFPETMRLTVSGIASIWSAQFQKHPRPASEGLLYAETQLWQKGDTAGDSWVLWLRSALKHSLGKDVQEVMSQHLQKR
jgi:hypothetical protein